MPLVQGRWQIALVVAAIAGLAIRLNNALVYPIDMGYDALGNWAYIELLLDSWRLPAPDQGWSTAHPPLFYYMAALVSHAVSGVVGVMSKPSSVQAIRLVTAASGLFGVWLAVHLVRRADPDNARRAFFAGALLLFLPVHIYMSAMLSEEILVTALISAAVTGVALDSLPRGGSNHALWRAAGFGVLAGLALLTKLSGLLVIGVGVVAYCVDGMRGEDRPGGLRRALAFGMSAAVVGGWIYVWNWTQYGFLYPHGLEVHSIMFTMPPGDRTLVDYLWVPWQTFIEPDLLSPSLLHSVWGSTYITVWFDGHGHFLSTMRSSVVSMGVAVLLLGLVPTIAFGFGIARGMGRIVRSVRGPDFALTLLVVATIAGYILFTWNNPWFVVLKGSFLLGLSIPFSYFASDVLADWTRGRNFRSVAVMGCLGLLAILVTITFSYGVGFEKHEMPGIPWEPVETPWRG
jgi:hypothetical protein